MWLPLCSCSRRQICCSLCMCGLAVLKQYTVVCATVHITHSTLHMYACCLCLHKCSHTLFSMTVPSQVGTLPYRLCCCLFGRLPVVSPLWVLLLWLSQRAGAKPGSCLSLAVIPKHVTVRLVAMLPPHIRWHGGSFQVLL